jgi:hypothetical protein
VDGLANFTQLTSLNLSDCYSLENVNGLASLIQLASLDLSDCCFLEDPDARWHPRPAYHLGNMGVRNDYDEMYRFPCCGISVRVSDGPVPARRSDGCQPQLDPARCENVCPKPSIAYMSTREDVAEYQELIKASMK